jgi:hypothetical protein
VTVVDRCSPPFSRPVRPFPALGIILTGDSSLACKGLYRGVRNVGVVVVLLAVPRLLHPHFPDGAASRITTRATTWVTVRADVRIMGNLAARSVRFSDGPPAALTVIVRGPIDARTPSTSPVAVRTGAIRPAIIGSGTKQCSTRPTTQP